MVWLAILVFATPSDLWVHNCLKSVEGHNLQLHAGADVFPYFDLTVLGPDSQYTFIQGRVAIVQHELHHNQHPIGQAAARQQDS